MREIFIVASLISIFLTVGCESPKSNPEAEQAAIKAAQDWLALIDGQDYSKSWDEAAAYFKEAVPKDQWTQMVAGVRGPLGELKARQVKSSRYKTSVPGAPDGEYVIIQFQASFDDKRSAVETVTPMREKDGSWRVSGYFIK
jgi:hypothetical protein